MDRPVALAAAETDGQTSPNVTGSSRWHLELLSDEGTDGCGGSVQREHQSSVTPRPRLSRHELSAAEGTALGSHQDRIRRFPESRVECAFVQIVVQNPMKNGVSETAGRMEFSYKQTDVVGGMTRLLLKRA